MHKTGKELHVYSYNTIKTFCIILLLLHAYMFILKCILMCVIHAGCDFTNGFLCLGDISIPDDNSDDKYSICSVVYIHASIHSMYSI